MASLKEIRRRIHSVENIKQITKSMEMVAAARLQKALVKADLSYRFLQYMKTILSRLLSAAPELTHPLFVTKHPAPVAVLAIGTDRGLCGSLNSTLYSTVDKFLKSHSSESIDLILFGRKAMEYYKRKHCPVTKSFEDWGGKHSVQMVKNFIEDLIEEGMAGKYSSIHLIYTEYQTVFTRQVVNVQLLPIEKPHEELKGSINADYIFEPNSEEVLDELLPRYCIAGLHNALNQTYASELAARVCAMKAAKNNADEMIGNLTLLRNKVRQAGITKEILEIASGAKAI